jgi:hypothetical protein
VILNAGKEEGEEVEEVLEEEVSFPVATQDVAAVFRSGTFREPTDPRRPRGSVSF